MRTLRFPILCIAGLVTWGTGICATPSTGVPTSMSVEFKAPPSPFLILSKEEIPQVRAKIQAQPWAKANADRILKKAETILSHPHEFPEKEAGWAHWYACPSCGSHLKFDPASPHSHICVQCGKKLEGPKYDAAWRYYSLLLTAGEQRTLAIAYLISGEAKYAKAMIPVWLDMAGKYSRYQPHDKSMVLGKDEWSGGRATSQWIDECNLLTALAPSYDVLRGAGVLSESDRKTIEDGFWANALQYMHSVMGRRNGGGNWDVWADSGSVVLGICFNDKELIDIGLNSQRGILAMLKGGYLNEDGFVNEHSIGYQSYAALAFYRLAAATRRVGIDFYQIPVFKKMLDLPLSLRQPDESLPCLNDGWQISLLPDEHGDGWSSFLELGWNWYQRPAYASALAEIYKAAPKNAREQIDEALLYGPAQLPANPAPISASTFLNDTMVAQLRQPATDWVALLKCDKYSAGHRHPDALGFQLYANGEPAFPGAGTPPYGHPTYLKWFTQSLSHSTVLINGHSQKIPTRNQKMEFGFSQGGLSAAQMSVEGVDKSIPLRMRRLILMTPHGVADVFGVEDLAKDLPEAKNASQEPQPILLDWVLQLSGSLEARNCKPLSNAALRIENQEQSPAYDYLHDVSQIESPETIHATLTQPKGGKIGLWLAPSPAEGKVLLAKRPGQSNSIDKELATLLQRRGLGQGAFASFYAPYRAQAQVSSVRFLKLPEFENGVAMEIAHVNGKDLVLSAPKTGELKADGAILNGSFGCEVSLPENHRQYVLVGTELKIAGTRLSLKQAGCVMLDSEGGKTKVSNASDKPLEGSFQMKSKTTSFSLSPGETKAL